MVKSEDAWRRLYDFRPTEEEANPRRRTRLEPYKVPALIFAALVATALMATARAVGSRPPASSADALFEALQAFLLNSPADPALGSGGAALAYETGRAIAVGIALFVGASLVRVLARSAWDSVKLFGLGNHVVVVGLGDKGFQLVSDICRSGGKVAVLDFADGPVRRDAARAKGAIVIHEDAREPTFLARARAERATAIVCLTGSDETNLEVAVACATRCRLAAVRRQTRASDWLGALERGLEKLDRWVAEWRSTRTCGRGGPASAPAAELPDTGAPRMIVQISDPELKRSLERRFPKGLGPLVDTRPVTPASMEVRLVNACENSARSLFWEYPLDLIARPADDDPLGPESDFEPHIAIVGLNDMGESVLLQAARTAVFPNYATHRLHVTVFDVDGGGEASVRDSSDLAGSGDQGGEPDVLRRLRSRLPGIAEAVALDAQPCDPLQSRDVATRIRDWARRLNAEGKPPLSAVYVCIDDDAASFRLADWLAVELDDAATPAFFRMKDAGGLALLASRDGRGGSSSMVPFGSVQLSCSRAALLDAQADRSARRLHTLYQSAPGGTGTAWADLSLALRQSNRHAVDHLPVKVRCAGLDVTTAPGAVVSIPEDKLDMLAELEHQRFCVERWCAGWIHAPVSEPDRLRNKCLVAWDQILADGVEEMRSLDYTPVEAIPTVLREVGLGLRERT